MKEAREVLYGQILEVIDMIELDMQKYIEKSDDDELDAVYFEIDTVRTLIKVLKMMNKAK